MNMKNFPLFVISGLFLLSPLEAQQDERPIDAYRRSDSYLRMHQEFAFLEETAAELSYDGDAPGISYVWNPSHTVAVFFSELPSACACYCRFWAYQKKQETWVQLGEYGFGSRYACVDLESMRIGIQGDGFWVSFRDGDTEVSHFFSFTKKQECFYYRWKKEG